MRFSYWGKRDEYISPTIEVTEREIQSGSYRTYGRCHTLAEVQVFQAPQPLESQNRIYSQRDDFKTEPKQGCKTRPIYSAICVSQQLRRIHSANIYRTLERRMQAAKDREDESLLRVLESELRETVLR